VLPTGILKKKYIYNKDSITGDKKTMESGDNSRLAWGYIAKKRREQEQENASVPSVWDFNHDPHKEEGGSDKVLRTFVYGTLKFGGSNFISMGLNHNLIKMVPAKILGATLYAFPKYPAAKEVSNSIVLGQILYLRDEEGVILRGLDRLERVKDRLYYRKTILAYPLDLSEPDGVECEAYFIHPNAFESGIRFKMLRKHQGEAWFE